MSALASDALARFCIATRACLAVMRESAAFMRAELTILVAESAVNCLHAHGEVSRARALCLPSSAADDPN